jgi:hypothetical protein
MVRGDSHFATPRPSQRAYVEALGIALAHELVRMNESTSSLASASN